MKQNGGYCILTFCILANSEDPDEKPLNLVTELNMLEKTG